MQKQNIFADSADQDETGHKELSHLDLHYFPFYILFGFIEASIWNIGSVQTIKMENTFSKTQIYESVKLTSIIFQSHTWYIVYLTAECVSALYALDIKHYTSTASASLQNVSLSK